MWHYCDSGTMKIKIEASPMLHPENETMTA